MGNFRWQHRQTGRFFNWGKPAGLPYQTSVTVDDRHHGPNWGKRGATMAMIVLSSPATSVTLDPINQKSIDPVIQLTC